MDKYQTNNFEENNIQNNEINLIFLVNLLFRNKLLITSFSIVFFVISCIYSLSLKRIWQGQFEIVISQKNNKVISNLQSSFSDLFFEESKGLNNSINTEVAILNSPSVLSPIFDYVTKQKKLNDINGELLFSNWINNLTVELKKGTTVLLINYRDTDKSIILPVLRKISKTYQSYSNKEKFRNIELSKIYLSDQINIFKDKSSKSIQMAQEYASDQDLSILGSIPLNSKSNTGISANTLRSPSPISLNSQFIMNSDIESIRVAAANEIRNINYLIKKIEDLDGFDVQYISLTIPELSKSTAVTSIGAVDNALIDLKSKYKPNDINIIALEKRRELLVSLLKQQSINFLKAKKIKTEAKLEASTRPKDVLIRYKKLLRKANREEKILIDLENQLMNVRLQEAKLEDPWQLITKPTLSKEPVGPQRKKIGLIGLALGAVFGTIFAYSKERLSGLIFEEEILEKLFKTKILEKYDVFTNKFIFNSKETFLNEVIFLNFKKSINFVVLGEIKSESVSKFKDLFINNEDFIKTGSKFSVLNYEDEFLNLNTCENLILVTSMNKITYKEVNNLKKRLITLNRNIDGVILLDE